jgi:hypothetical protein
MPAVIGSNQAARIATLARQKVMEKMLAKVGRNPRPFINFLDSRKKPTQFPGNGIMVGIKEIAVNINAQKWSGTPTLQNANGIQNTLWAEFKSSNMFANTQWGYDDLRKASGVTILPNQNGADTAMARVAASDGDSSRVLYNRLVEDMESFADRTEQLRDLEAHRPGATADDLAGLFAIMPMSMTGQYGGIDRASNPAVQHVLFAGTVAEISGVPWIGAAGTTGASGTLLSQLEKFIRALRTAAFGAGLPKGKWKLFGGSGFFDKLKAQLRLEKVAFNIDAASGDSKLNLLITDERLGLSSPDLDLVLDFTLDQMDLDFASEIGLAPSQITATFSGGTFENGVSAGQVITGSGPNAGQIARHAKGFVTVTAAGALSQVFVTDPGVGYTAVPTVTLGNVGGGTGGSVSQVKIFSTSSGAAFTTVPSDDTRIGRVDAANFTVVAGSGYPTTGTAAPATNRLYAVYEPAWEYLVQEGLDSFMSIPADNPRARQLEQQWDHTHALTNCCPRVNGILVAA